ncbi:MAG TPA: hypothetical protein VGV18_08985, partial [Verrucomicrobiae bacterium]|nr:hypothetical protein [Verrucomicrobiae bacterium]
MAAPFSQGCVNPRPPRRLPQRSISCAPINLNKIKTGPKFFQESHRLVRIIVPGAPIDFAAHFRERGIFS